MPKVTALQNNFNAGEMSPLMYARSDVQKYKNALEKCYNAWPIVQGGWTRRPGTAYAAEVKTSSKRTRIVPFQFSVTQAYILEFGDLYVRFYKNHGQILSGMVPYEVATPYTEDQLRDLKFTQSADVLYITHPNHMQRKLSRLADTNWTLSVINFSDGPYLPQTQSPTGTTLTPSATSGLGVTVTASSTAGINDGSGFLATDVNRHIRLNNAGVGTPVWGWAQIKSVVSPTVVTVDIGRGFAGTTATTNWRLGVWSDTTGYPACVTFFEDRLFFGGSLQFPQRLDGSNSGDYENFQPTLSDGSVVATNALSFTLNSSDVNVIRWMQDDEKALLVGTVGGEWLVRANTQSEALSPTNVNAKRSTVYGSANLAPIRAGKAVVFVQRAGKKLRELAYVFEVDGFRAPDMTVLSEHITRPSVSELAFRQEPVSIIWAARSDGVLAGMTYERDQDVLGWHRHEIGGSFQGGRAVVESIACIPAPDGSYDELWMIVKRTINGLTKRYIEYMTKDWEDGDVQDAAWFVDCGATLTAAVNGTLTPDINATVKGATGIAFTSSVAAFAPGDVGREIHYRYRDAAGVQYLARAVITLYVSPTNVLADIIFPWPNLNIVAANAWGLTFTTVSALDFLEGQTVQVLADGATHPDRVVTGGAITLARPASRVQIGLGYNSDLKTLKMDVGAADGTAQGKTQRIHRVAIQFFQSVGCKVGPNFNELDAEIFRDVGDPMGQAPQLFTGVRTLPFDGGYEIGAQMCFRQDQPFPLTILSIVPQLHTQDR